MVISYTTENKWLNTDEIETHSADSITLIVLPSLSDLKDIISATWGMYGILGSNVVGWSTGN